MRRLAAMFTALLAAILAMSSAQAMGPNAARSLGAAAATLAPAESVACYGFGWRGWGVYPGWLRPACWGAAYAPPGYVVGAAPVYAVPAPIYPAPAPQRCWVQTDPARNYGYWAAC